MTETAWIQIIATILGAIISGICAIIVAVLEKKIEKKRLPGEIKKERRKRNKTKKMTLIIIILLIGGVIGFCIGLVINAIKQNDLVGKSPGSSYQYQIYPDYSPSGFMGDIGDIKSPMKSSGGVSFTYEVCGRGPHEWEYKYINREINENPAKFAGVMYLMTNQWWLSPDSGEDLRGFRSIRWEARSLQEEVHVEFKIGGMDWIWDQANNVIQSVKYPDSMPGDSLGIYTLTPAWQEFQVTLAEHIEDHFKYVVGGFAWIIDWGSNNIELDNPGTCPLQPKIIQIEIRNIRYER